MSRAFQENQCFTCILNLHDKESKAAALADAELLAELEKEMWANK